MLVRRFDTAAISGDVLAPTGKAAFADMHELISMDLTQVEGHGPSEHDSETSKLSSHMHTFAAAAVHTFPVLTYFLNVRSNKTACSCRLR